MKPDTVKRLNAINREFYATTAESFDQTRGKPWPGWDTLLTHLPDKPLSVLDVGCGNGRFGVFLAEKHTHPLQYVGLDNNAKLLEFADAWLEQADNITYRLQVWDVVETPIETNHYDVIGVFGVIHHVPGFDNRRQFVRHLASLLNPGGLLVFACWRFYDYERFRQRVTPWPDDLVGEVEKNDYVLDWRRGEVALRYCHHVDDEEHTALIAATGLTEITTYSADGFSGAVNRYSVLLRT